MHPFRYDPFQEEAIRTIQKGESLFVSAPTGAGKTVIAEIAVQEALKANGMAIYTAPIKALSNQKFRDFHAIYGDQVGILTGDVTLNPQAPLLIMTTEIYRNSLFSAEGGSASGGEDAFRFARCRWVIFDEVHFLDDPDRGTVWEEALLLTPRETEILALSATIPNAKELAGWIAKIHGRPVKVIEETHRLVPLRFYFQCQDQLFHDVSQLKMKGYENREVWKRKEHRVPRMRFRGGRRSFQWAQQRKETFGKANRADHLLKEIERAGHLPCLYFSFSRRRAEELAWEFAAQHLLPPEKKLQLTEQFDALCRRFEITHERSAQEMRQLIGEGIAFHHAGLLPTLKEVVEILFASRLVQVIVTTETFALGVNMPARSVVLDTLIKGPLHSKTILQVRELSQMAGRAGRRGMDEEGFVYLRVNPWEVPFYSLSHLLEGKPEQVKSRFNSTYATLLNLYRTYRMELLPFYEQTFHAFQAPRAHQRETFGLIERKLTLLTEWRYIGPEGLTPKGVFASGLYGYELILAELADVGWLDTLDLADLGIFLLGMVFEPRRSLFQVKLPRRVRALSEGIEDILTGIHKEERRLRISPLTKGPAFQLSGAMELWLGGARFDRVVQAVNVDEGELIRYFRMTLQLARALATDPGSSPTLKEKSWRLFKKINRDPVDAEAELRRSL